MYREGENIIEQIWEENLDRVKGKVPRRVWKEREKRLKAKERVEK